MCLKLFSHANSYEFILASMRYVVYEFFTTDEMERDWIIALFTDQHFDGFEETSASVKGYVAEPRVRSLLVKEVLFDNDLHHVRFTATPVEEKNWNEEWEKNFEPVVIDEKVAIRAPFHSAIKADYEIIIEPKMSFGTGHHATTAAMIELMLNENIAGKQVLDFGSGTGVLSILAEKLNAAAVTAIDNEVWAYNNCMENTSLNNCINIKSIHGDDTYRFTEKYDVILANINRNVILKNLEMWKTLLKAGGWLMISGILLSDEQDIINAAALSKLYVKKSVRKDGWMAMILN